MKVVTLEEAQHLIKQDTKKTIMAVWRYLHGYTGELGYLVCTSPGLLEMFDTEYACNPTLIYWLGGWIQERDHVLRF